MRQPVDSTSFSDSSTRGRLRRLVVGGGARLGLHIEPLDDTAHFIDDESTCIPEMVARFNEIPGMLPIRRAIHLYMLAFANGVRGDCIEIGSWQGRSTAYLAQACMDTDNGLVHAIDTFKGNPGNEDTYHAGGVVDIEAAFRGHMQRVGVSERVITWAKASEDAIAEVRTATDGARLLFIDGFHEYSAVKQDLDNYADLVLPGGLIVLDDYSPFFRDGVVKAANEHIAANRGRYARPFQQKNMLALPRVN